MRSYESMSPEEHIHAERRDQFAAAALTGILANTLTADMNRSESDIARCAVSQADALLAALDGTEGT